MYGAQVSNVTKLFFSFSVTQEANHTTNLSVIPKLLCRGEERRPW